VKWASNRNVNARKANAFHFPYLGSALDPTPRGGRAYKNQLHCLLFY